MNKDAIEIISTHIKDSIPVGKTYQFNDKKLGDKGNKDFLIDFQVGGTDEPILWTIKSLMASKEVNVRIGYNQELNLDNNTLSNIVDILSMKLLSDHNLGGNIYTVGQLLTEYSAYEEKGLRDVIISIPVQYILENDNTN